MKKYILFTFSLFILISCTVKNTREVVRSYINAHNTHDIDKALTYYDENVVFELKRVWKKEGLREMRSLEEWDAALNSNLKLESVTIKEDSVFCRIVENSDWLSSIGITDLINDPVVFVVSNGKIKQVIAYPSKEIGKKIEATIAAIYQWSQKTQDHTIDDLIQNGQFVYSADAAEKWLDLINRWKTSNNVK